MRQSWGSNTIDFFYDATGNPYALKYNGTLYYYITNLQGDVVHIVDTSGTPVVSYTYDPYGKPTVTSDTSNVSLGTINPLRYRGYVYDEETGLYYLQSRYYDPTTGRFINADGYASTGQGVLGNNMFAYCLNNPASMIDTNGEDAIYVVDFGPYGLPLVGHGYVYIQDEEGNWYKTEFSGQFPHKRTARILFDEVTSVGQEEIDAMIRGEHIQDKVYVYISGDFDESVAYAKKWDKTNYNGYNLIDNNCMDYCQDVLLQGEFDNRREYQAMASYQKPVPSLLYIKIVNAKYLIMN